MSDHKRRGSDLQGPSKRQHVTQEGEPEYMLSSRPSSSQGEPAATAKTLTDYTPEEKAYWREFNSPEELTRVFSFSQVQKDDLKDTLQQYSENLEVAFHDCLVEVASVHLGSIKGLLGGTGGIAWDFLLNPHPDQTEFLHNTRPGQTEAFGDNLVFTWIEVMKVHPHIVPFKKKEYEQVLRKLVPAIKDPNSAMAWFAIESRFRIEQRRTADGYYPSDAVFKKLIGYYKSFNRSTDLSPYTSIVGPSGIGKSYAISQMAKTHDLYVVYASFADEHSATFPKRSAIAQVVSEVRGRDRATLFFFWCCYLKAGLLDVEICRRIGISPGTFYDMQTSSYDQYQKGFAERVKTLFELYKKGSVKAGGIKSQAVSETFKKLAKSSQKSLSDLKKRLQDDTNNDQKGAGVARTEGIPDALFCVDEARALLDEEGSMPFRSLRTALRQLFGRSDKTKPLDIDSTVCDWFGIFLDTTSRVANFSPPARIDRSQRQVPGDEPWGDRNWNLFPPIFSIDTFDLFANSDHAMYPDGSEQATASLFRTGRPLWGAMIAQNNSAGGAYDLAVSKTAGQGTPRALALLSYRLNFYIFSNALAETLVSGWLRYVSYISPGRETMRTTQPTEPILAHSAAMSMREPDIRLEVISRFVTASWEGTIGTINLGDLGEMAAAITILLSYDEAFARTKLEYPGSVPLTNFMEALLGDVAGEISDCANTGDQMTTLWNEGRVFCNHFARLQKRPNEATLTSAFHRGTGLFLPDHFPGADILVPVAITTAEQSRMSFLAIQVKNRKRDTYSKHLANETESSLTRAAQELGLQCQYIGIAMALRPHDGGGKSFDIVQPKRVTRGKHAGNYQWLSAKDKKSKAPKAEALMLLVTGFDGDIYPSISSEIVPLLQSLLDCHGGASVPSDPDNRAYASRLMPLEWRPEPKVKEEEELGAEEAKDPKGKKPEKGEQVEGEQAEDSGNDSDVEMV
ncbi:hypothetical protein PHISP_04561 [Aspergillus sp. HF37]|nr:hypothetical protein PHISP_04561 [Aspergillus sp. HF37]